jgi:Contact-dependent growth inhibition CdiA C-terminal domain
LTAERPATERPEWEIPLSRDEVDRCGLGVIDERAKQFSPAERRIAEHLARQGPAVVSVAEGFGIYGRTPDARVNGVPVEFKSLDPGASDRTVKAALNSAKGQARPAVIDARDSGLTEDHAHRGIRRFSGTPHGNRLEAVLIVGDNYYIDWKRAG